MSYSAGRFMINIDIRKQKIIEFLNSLIHEKCLKNSEIKVETRTKDEIFITLSSKSINTISIDIRLSSDFGGVDVILSDQINIEILATEDLFLELRSICIIAIEGNLWEEQWIKNNKVVARRITYLLNGTKNEVSFDLFSRFRSIGAIKKIIKFNSYS